MHCVCVSRLKCSTVAAKLAETSSSSWTDKTTLQTKIPITKLKDTDRKFLGQRGQECRCEDQGRGKGRRDRKDWKRERERLTFQPIACGYLFRYQPVCFQKGPVKERASCALPTKVIKPRNQTIVRCLWERNPKVDTHLCIHQYTEICHFSPFPVELLLVAGNKGENIGTIGLLATTRYELWTSITLINLRSGSAYCANVCIEWGEPLPPLPVTHQGEPLPARGNTALQAAWSDAAAAWCPLSLRRIGLKKERTEREVGRFQEKERGKRKEKVLRGKGQRGRERVAWMRVLSPLGTGRQTYQIWWRWNKRFSWSLATHEEVAFGGPGGTQILSSEGNKCPMLAATKCYWPGFLASLIDRNWPEVRQEIQARFYWGLRCSRKGVRTNNRFPCLLAPECPPF